MKSLTIGLVDLDTSHPGSFVPILRDMGHRVTAVYDTGEVNPPGYAARFAQEHSIETACESLDQMAEQVDAVFISSCNWDVHVDRARPFIEAGVAVFIDKPMAGNRRDLMQLVEWEKQGATITGGSSLRYVPEVREWAGKIAAEDWVYAMAGCAVDEFNYGIHAYTMLQGLLGAGIHEVRHIGTTGQHQIELTWRDGRRGLLNVGKTKRYLPFYANVVAQQEVGYFQVDSSRIYSSMLEAVCPYLAGEAPAPMAMEQLAEVELSAIAAKISIEKEGKPVKLEEVPMEYAGYDGKSFASYYKEMKYPSLKAGKS
ncbi:Gfo/Idh/MocA family protein [Paenibacillus chungangensis]|uniref:Gfo/Idh/MocA family protein n=1 Tax=Paenibacillus chungangensis TaxID=696535 RepID=A0ABW3HSG3_9BACL